MSKIYPSPQSIQGNLQHTLYDPRFESDACGIGFVAYSDGRPHPDVLPMALRALSNLVHRGGVLADGKTSDGAGIMCQLPHPFFAQKLQKDGIAPPEAGSLAVGQFFLPKNDERLTQSLALVEDALARPELGLRLLAWRNAPLDHRILGPQAEATQPIIRQAMVAPWQPMEQAEFERRLYLARRIIEKRAGEADLPELYICSMSSQVIVYKGLLLGNDLGKFYTDLLHHDFQVGLATFHQRYSTNTFPAWHRAQPFRLLCHNGEINTVQGNVNWMRARESKLQADVWGDKIEYLKPVIDESGSDSAMLDNVLELLVQSGRDLPHAISMLVPEAWEMLPDTPENRARRDFYAYHSCLMEPWDGPAALVFSDGKTVGITLDRNGLRPIRYQQTNTGLITAGSEAGFIEVDQAAVIKKGQLGPGQMLVVDTEKQTTYFDDEIKQKLADEANYGRWVEEMIIPLPSRLIPSQDMGNSNPALNLPLAQYQSAFGYTAEELTVILRPMAEKGMEPIGSMGDDTPIAYLSRVNRPVHHYLKQRFAQVTNPPIDPLREKSGMSLKILLGRRENILKEGPERATQILLESPVLQSDDLTAIQQLNEGDNQDFTTIKLYVTFPSNKGPNYLRTALENLVRVAEGAVRRRADRATVIVISDKSLASDAVPIPILLAVGAVHHHLIKTGLRSQVSLIVETGEVRDVHHFAALIAYGAEAVNPYLALATIAELTKAGKIKGVSPLEAAANFSRALEKGLLKIMSKMGISTIDSYCGAQIFEAIGLGQDVIDLCLRGTPSKLGGASLSALAQSALARHANAFGPQGPRLESYGLFKFKRNGEYHGFNPSLVKTLRQAVKTNSYETYQEFSRLNHEGSAALPQNDLSIRSDRSPIPLDEVEPVSEIVRRFSTAAISHGAISSEAHRTLAIAMNRLGGMSNSGEGGEAADRLHAEDNSAVKQIASGRFGVTPTYLMSAREIQIKMAQGAKPGEGGHLPGHKVSVEIAAMRHSTPGVGLISPPPHHDIYSIEDLAQLIFDLKQINPMAAVSVKLVAASGVGTIAAGVVKGGADVVLISGDSGGTGAAALSSIKHVGLPLELGLAETQQTLIGNDLRDRVRLRVDGGLKTGRDVTLAALLGADEYSFGTAAMIAEGCIMARVCHANSCPVGVATQRPELRAKFSGTPEMVMAYMKFVAQEVREMLAEMGYRSLNDIIGRSDLLAQTGQIGLDLSPLLATPDKKGILPRRNILPGNDIIRVTPMNWHLLELARPTLREGKKLSRRMKIRNTDRSVGATLSGAIAAQYGARGLPENQIHFTFTGSAGQSFGVFNSSGVHLTVIGEANDYVGKGMAGGEIILKPSPEAPIESHKNAILGNTALYGATGGHLYAAGLAGERFAVRNSGAIAVVEGTGHHGCEYMTGGVAVILGEVGFNFGAGMTGGVAYVLDDTLPIKLNPDMVEILPLDKPEDVATVYRLILAHAIKTSSVHARNILENWDALLSAFKKVEPIEKAPAPPTSAEKALALDKTGVAAKK